MVDYETSGKKLLKLTSQRVRKILPFSLKFNFFKREKKNIYIIFKLINYI